MCNYNQKIQRLTADLKNSLAVKVIVIFNCKYMSRLHLYASDVHNLADYNYYFFNYPSMLKRQDLVLMFILVLVSGENV